MTTEWMKLQKLHCDQNHPDILFQKQINPNNNLNSILMKVHINIISLIINIINCTEQHVQISKNISSFQVSQYSYNTRPSQSNIFCSPNACIFFYFSPLHRARVVIQQAQKNVDSVYFFKWHTTIWSCY